MPQPVLLDQTGIFTFEGDLASGTVIVADAPNDRWKLEVDGNEVARDDRVRMGELLHDPDPGAASLSFDTPVDSHARDRRPGRALGRLDPAAPAVAHLDAVAPPSAGHGAGVRGPPTTALLTSGRARDVRSTDADVRRLPILLVFGGLLAAGLVVDRTRRPRTRSTFGTATAPVQPVADTGRAATTTWFCPGVPAPPDGSTAGFVTMSNPTDAELPAC